MPPGLLYGYHFSGAAGEAVQPGFNRLALGPEHQREQYRGNQQDNELSDRRLGLGQNYEGNKTD